MKISESEARDVIRLIRNARERYTRIAGDAQCEKSKMIFLALDIAELTVADETTDDYKEPRLLVTIGNLIKGLTLWKDIMVDRIRRHPIAAELFN